MSIPVPDWYRLDAINRYALKPNEQAVYDCLCYHAHGRTRIAWPSQVRIAEERKLNPRTVKRAMARLAEVGLIVQQDVGRPGRSARWLIADFHPRGRSNFAAPTRRAEWGEMANGLVGVDLVETERHEIWNSTSALGPEVAPEIALNSTLGITRQNGSTSAPRPPEDKGTPRTHVAPSSADAENDPRFAAVVADDEAEEEERPSLGSLPSGASRRGRDASNAWDEEDPIEDPLASAAQRATFAPKAQPLTREQVRALADLARMIEDDDIDAVDITAMDRDEAAELIRLLRGEQYRRIYCETPFDCTLADLSAGAQRYFRDRDLDHLFG